MKTVIFLFSLLFVSSYASAQSKMLVFFKDKGEQKLEHFNFTERSLQRRIKNGSSFDHRDIPVNQDYVLQLNQDGQVLNASRWINAISFTSDLSAPELKEKYSFIDRIQVIQKGNSIVANKFEVEDKTLNYGHAYEQIHQLNLECLHDMNYTGTGVYLAVIDAGFNNMDAIDYFDSLYIENRLLDKYDFVNNDATVYHSSGHGTAVSSCIIAEKNAPDSIAGTAVDVDLALYLSEDSGSETEIEEFNLVLALERCDSVGVDVANISLGYFTFDDSTTNHVYADMDGETTIAAVGVNVAASKGIAVIASAGNGGPGKISTPCDADSCLCIGAVSVNGTYAPFSSVGPSADGQVKPDVTAAGWGVYIVAANGDIDQSSGTSFSSPITAGATACLIQANPTKTVEEIFDAIRQSASQFAAPDSLFGYGIPDFCAANDLLSNVGLSENEKEAIQVYPNPANDFVFIDLSKVSQVQKVEVLDAMGRIVLTEHSIKADNVLLDTRSLNSGYYTVRIMGDSNYARKLLIKR